MSRSCVQIPPPKRFAPHPWHWARQFGEGIMEQLNQKSIKYNWHEADVSVLEGILARGDRKLANVILYAYQNGCMFDSWSECFHYDIWMSGFENCAVDPDFYTVRERKDDEIFPWDFLDCGVTKEFWSGMLFQ